MQRPLQVSFKDVKHSDAIEEAIRERVEKLERLYSRITSCRVVVEMPHKHHHKGKLFQIRIDLSVPGHEIVVNREPDEDVYIAIKAAFTAAQRQLQDHVSRRRGEVKVHADLPQGQVVRLFPDEGYGFISTDGVREVYFHEHSVQDRGFARLKIGTPVRFSEEPGENGPQATSVQTLGNKP